MEGVTKEVLKLFYSHAGNSAFLLMCFLNPGTGSLFQPQCLSDKTQYTVVVQL